MSFYLVVWLGYVCPGGLLSGFIPAPARPLVCRPAPQHELFDPARITAARLKVRVEGQNARLYSCHGLRCSEARVIWTTEAKFE